MKKKQLATWLLSNTDASPLLALCLFSHYIFFSEPENLVGFLEASETGIESDNKAKNIWVDCFYVFIYITVVPIKSIIFKKHTVSQN